MIDVKVLRENGFEDISLPTYQTEGSSGLDLKAAIAEEIFLMPGECKLIPTGIRLEIPIGYEGQVRPRSGLALNHNIGMLNPPGTIDSDYRGIVSVILFNFGKEKFSIKRGDRIAQLVFQKVERANLIVVDALSDTKRGDGGFGHTGKN